VRYEEVQEVEMLNFAFLGKIWGMSASEWGYWMPGDCSRWDYKKFVALEIGSCITPSFTCPDMDKAYSIIMQQVEGHKK
jgi:hypothetical protein